VDPEVVERALELEGVDALGLDDLDRRYLRTLMVQYEGRPTGVTALAASMQQEVDTLEEVVEPYLLHEGFLLRTPTGRLASGKAYAHLRLSPPSRVASVQQPLLLDDESA
jgi:holliday junction DNA helicase RuvB